MSIKNIKKFNLIIFFTTLVVGILIINQSVIISKAKDLTKEDNVLKLSYEIIEIADSNFELQNELNRLRVKNESFSFDIKDKARIKEDLDKKINSYRIANGFEGINGRGIEIKVEGNMVTEEIVDLINGIRNVNPDAIGINNKRIVYKSYFVISNDSRLELDEEFFSFPIFIQVVGDPDVLKKSLDRSGGILDVLKKNSFNKINFSVESKDNIELPAYSGELIFKYAKTVTY